MSLIQDVFDGKYEVLEKIGQGGMGAVLKVKNLESGNYLALKYCIDEDEDSLRRFKRETRIMQGIENKHVMKILYSNIEYTPPYFVMPLAKSSLSEEIPTLSDDIYNKLRIFKEVCLGVQAIHNSDATHRDLKPDNIMRMNDGSIVVSDLGLSKLNNRDSTILTDTNIMLGTPVYCAPEQLRMGGTKNANQQTDVYQLGKVLYKIITKDSPALMDLDLIPTGLRYVVKKATEHEPRNRYETVSKMMNAIESYVQSTDPQTNPKVHFSLLIEKACQKLETDKYSSQNLKEILSKLILFTDDNELFLQKFNEIPLPLLNVVSSKNYSQFASVVNSYYLAISEEVHKYSFAYADHVAKKMLTIFSATEQSNIKADCVLATLIAAVELNRYSAMDTFDNMLTNIKEIELALMVAEGLEKHIDCYDKVVDRISKSHLHVALHSIYDQASDKN